MGSGRDVNPSQKNAPPEWGSGAVPPEKFWNFTLESVHLVHLEGYSPLKNMNE